MSIDKKFNNAVGPLVREKKVKQSKLPQIIGGISLIGGFQLSTQIFAARFAYHDSLGGSIGNVYAPWKIVEWWQSYITQYPDELMRAVGFGITASTVGLLATGILQVVNKNTGKANKYLHGSARWAELEDIKSAGLLPADLPLIKKLLGHKKPEGEGVYVGAYIDKKGDFHYLRHNGPEHVLTYAPTRSGKGVGLVVPTLLSWTKSAVITDLKGELWALTAGWRKKYANNHVLKFEPAAKNGGCAWNPLDEIRLGTEYETGDVQNLAQLIVDPDGKGLVSHWDKTAFALLTGVIMHSLYKAKAEGNTATLPGIDAMLAPAGGDIQSLWVEMTIYEHFEDGTNHPAIGRAGQDMLDRPEEEAGSVLSTAKSYLSLYRDPIVAENVSRSDFLIKDLMHQDKAVSLYIVTQPNDKDRLRPIVRIALNMIIRLLADKMDFEQGRPVAHYKHRLLMMIDEFPSLGKLDILQESLAYVAGYGIKCYLITQDINQLKSREKGYGPDETITSNCHVQNAYPPNRPETADHLSKLTGQTTVAREQITTSGKRFSAMMGNVSKSYQETQRPLLTPDECLRMPGPKKNTKNEITEAGDMVVYVAGYPAIYGKQPLYFKDPVFSARAAVEAPKVTDSIRRGSYE